LKDETLAQQLQTSAIDFGVLHAKYHPMLALVKELIGVIPNCDPLLEIWPPGFRTYNLLVPNGLNLPFSLWGFGAPKALTGLAMYTSSRAAFCAYCSAHTCSFALRRGAREASLVGRRTPPEAAVVTVAEGLSRIPCDLTAAQCETLSDHFSPEDIEWFVLSVGLMGFLNKFMDAVGVALEVESMAEVGPLLKATGWTPGQHFSNAVPSSTGPPPIDSPETYFRILKQLPSAIWMEQQWTAGVPDRWPEAGTFLEKQTGYSFPLLSKLRHKRMIRALTTVLRDNLNAAQTKVGLTAKCLTALVYATVVENKTLAMEARLLAVRLAPELDERTFATIEQFAHNPLGKDVMAIEQAIATLSSLPILSEQDAAAIILAHAASTSPAEITPAILSNVSPRLHPASMIELLVWLSVQQLLHRLGCFYAVTQP
jgi:hypothetical protein